MEDKEIIEHLFHEHPVKRIPNVVEKTGWGTFCVGCWRFFLPEEAAYGCSIGCGYEYCLHEECAEMAREIRHPLHPSHPLSLAHFKYPSHPLSLAHFKYGLSVDDQCVVCDDSIKYGLVYGCSHGCDELWIHLGCAGGGMQVAPNELVMTHPSHPQHELRFFKRWCTFRCDACGTTEKGNSYICTICQYCIHENCASLPAIAGFNHHPDHNLLLAFHLPYEYCLYEYTCRICNGALRLRHWIYHCKLCRYAVHIKCADNTSHAAASNMIIDESGDDDKDILKAPIGDMYEEIIKPFVARQKGEISISHQDNSAHYKFHKQDHPLSFTRFLSSSSSSRDHNEQEQDSDDDDDDNCEASELRCNACTVPINNKSSDEGYMSCGKCKYFLHLACFNLPLLLPSHPLHQIQGHELSLESISEKFTYMGWMWCITCRMPTNGLSYSCTKCYFKIDVKCASLPDTIRHGAHPQHHHLKLVTDTHQRGFCVACYQITGEERKYYRCDNCRYSVCCKCVLLSACNIHILEKHVLPLTYDASVNHPGEFYCSSCEQKMNPKKWMYHCRDCDQSFHPDCCPATSGEYRNINFGMHQYQDSCHPNHPLKFQLISKKNRCDVCHYETYDEPGYQCTYCNFIMCRHHDVQRITC